ncbi:unnamed protein product [Rhizopus stolonifer]
MKSWIAAISLLFTLTQAALHQFELTIDYRAVNPDCHKSFEVPTINGQFPGPTLHVTLGDEVEILVKNDMDNTNTSIHYHGIRQIGTTESDGVPGVTQEPIQPGERFLQRFKVTQAGTYFYHAHVGLQDDSVQGAFIVYESHKSNPKIRNQCTSPYRDLLAGPYHYKKDLVLQLSEWWHDELESRQDYYLGSAFKYDHGANSILINGNSIYAPLKADQRRCLGYTTFDVEPNSVYRLRVIGGNTFRTLALGIRDHNMTIIEVDGELVHSLETSFLEVTPGQRFSVLLKTGDYLPGETFAIATGYLWRQRGRGITENGFGYLRYVEKDTKTNHDQLFKPLSKWFEPKKPHAKSWGKRSEIEVHGKTRGHDGEHKKIQVHGKHQRRAGLPQEKHNRFHGKQPHHVHQEPVKKPNQEPNEKRPKQKPGQRDWSRQRDRHPSNAPVGHGGQWVNTDGGHHGGGHQEHREYADLPSFPRRDTVDWLWHQLRPLADRDPILDETHVRTIRLHTSLTRLSDNTTRYLVNNRMNPERDQPALERYQQCHKRALDVYDDMFYTDLHTYRLGYNETVDLVFQNTLNKGGGCMLHPWHTHGHSHYVIASGAGEYLHARDQHIRNFDYPLYKDTSVAYPSYAHGGRTDGCGWTKVRIKADNPGFWAVHCHITTHMLQGKIVVLEEAPDWIEKTSLY